MTPASSDAGRVVAWVCTERTTGPIENRALPEPFVASNHAYVLAHPAHNWKELAPAATLSALQRKLDAVGELVADLEASQISSNLGSLYAAGAAAGLRHAIDRMRALLGSDATTNEETK